MKRVTIVLAMGVLTGLLAASILADPLGREMEIAWNVISM